MKFIYIMTVMLIAVITSVPLSENRLVARGGKAGQKSGGSNTPNNNTGAGGPVTMGSIFTKILDVVQIVLPLVSKYVGGSKNKRSDGATINQLISRNPKNENAELESDIREVVNAVLPIFQDFFQG